jgi:hypothetical protein
MRKLLEAFLILTADEKILAKCPRELDINDLCGPDLADLQDHNLFALQLFHRWCLRVFIFSKYSINWPKSLNPVSHMRVTGTSGCSSSSSSNTTGGHHVDESNNSIVKRIANMSDDSVEFLEEFVRLLNRHKTTAAAAKLASKTSPSSTSNTQHAERVISRPTSSCIRKINLVNGTFSLDWSVHGSGNGSVTNSQTNLIQVDTDNLNNSVIFRLFGYRVNFKYFHFLNVYKKIITSHHSTSDIPF